MKLTIYYKKHISESFSETTQSGDVSELRKLQRQYEKEYLAGNLAALRVEYTKD